MHFLVATLVLVAFAVVTATGHSHHVHHHDHHGHGEAVSYAMVTKYEDHTSRGQPYHTAHHGHVKQYEDHVGHDDLGQHHDHHGHAKYDFTYGVKDPKTGDVKSQWESRNGDSVKGGYALKEADGTTRIVKYTADKRKGFEATVHKAGKAHHNHSHHGHQEHQSHSSGFAVHHDQFTAHHSPGHHAYAGHHGHQEQKGHATSYIVVKKEVKH